MENAQRRITRKQGRRHDALRRTLRRQGLAVGPVIEEVSYEQVGGARSNTVTLAKLQAAFTATGIQVAGSDFAFLANNTWYEQEDAASNYMTLIGKQDTFFQLAFTKIQTELGLTNESKDADIMLAITRKKPEEIDSLLNIMKACVNLVALNDFDTFKSGTTYTADSCAGKYKSKFHNLLYRENIDFLNDYCSDCAREIGQEETAPSPQSVVKKQRVQLYSLATILLHPLLVKNVSITAIATIIKNLKADEPTLELINRPTADWTIKTFSSLFLIEKFASYISQSSSQLINDIPKDVFFLWGCSPGDSTYWEKFFVYVIKMIQEDTTNAYTQEKAVVDPGVAGIDTKQIDNFLNPFGNITGLVYKNQANSLQEILTLFAGEESVAIPVAGVSGRSSRAPASPPADALTGMLASKMWDKPLFPSAIEGGAAAKPLTFGRLMKRLSVTELHYLIHLVHVLKEQQESNAGVSGGGSAASSGGAAP